MSNTEIVIEKKYTHPYAGQHHVHAHLCRTPRARNALVSICHRPIEHSSDVRSRMPRMLCNQLHQCSAPRVFFTPRCHASVCVFFFLVAAVCSDPDNTIRVRVYQSRTGCVCLCCANKMFPYMYRCAGLRVESRCAMPSSATTINLFVDHTPARPL